MTTQTFRLGCLAAACMSLSAHAADPLVVKIGHVAALSGPAAHLGHDNENGVRMAIEELNAKGVQIGGRTARFELLAEDDAGDPKQGTAAAQKLVDSKVQGVVGHLNSGTAIPAARIYADAGIPQIAPSVTNPRYTRQGFKTTFRMVADDVQLGGTLGRYAVQTLKAKTIAVIDDRTAYGQGVAAEFEKAAKAAGATIAKREFTSDKATDFTAILTGIKSAKPDVIFYGGMDAVAGPMLRQMKQLGIAAKFMGGDGVCTAELSKLAASQLPDGQVVCAIAGGVDPAQKPALDKFKADFKKKFGSEVQIYAPYTYDATRAMVDAMVKAGSSDPA
ncbi:MAG: branched-chain amino acid ABC transporter substrate-binding protein, partial [Burkholderiales bacterium]|nr:branched-chain amino acid ABC transporter substrate-binding protein [Burkholderiales bacterium]